MISSENPPINYKMIKTTPAKVGANKTSPYNKTILIPLASTSGFFYNFICYIIQLGYERYFV